MSTLLNSYNLKDPEYSYLKTKTHKPLKKFHKSNKIKKITHYTKPTSNTLKDKIILRTKRLTNTFIQLKNTLYDFTYLYTNEYFRPTKKINTKFGKYDKTNILNNETFLYRTALDQCKYYELIPIPCHNQEGLYYIFNINELMEYITFCKNNNVKIYNPYELIEFSDNCINNIQKLYFYNKISLLSL